MNEGKITEIIQETKDVKTFKLDSKIDFVPGQYCLVALPEDEYDKRPFTFANSPMDNHIEFTIKQIGEFTTKLHSLKVGDKLLFSSAKGTSLNFDESVSKDVVFIAGGSGITPFMSILRFAIKKKLKNRQNLLQEMKRNNISQRTGND